MKKILFIAVVLLVTAASLPLRAGAADPFVINVILPLTGSSSFAGHELQSALVGLQDYVNKTGGVRGRPIEFAVQDDQTNPQLTVQLVNGLIAKGIPLVLGPDLTAPCAAAAPLGQKSGPVMYCFSNGVHPISGSFMFSANPSTVDLLRVATRYFRERKWSRIAVLAGTDATGQDGERSLADALASPENASLKVVDREHFNPTDVSVSAQMARIKASNADVLVAWTTGTPLATVLRGANDIALNLPILTSSGNAIPAQIKQYEAFLPKDLIIAGVGSLVPQMVQDRGQRSAIDVYFKAMAAISEKPNFMKTAAWDPGLLVVNAYRALGFNASADQLRTYLSNLKGFTGVDGSYDFHAIPQRGIGLSSIYMVRWDNAKGDWTGLSRGGGQPLK